MVSSAPSRPLHRSAGPVGSVVLGSVIEAAFVRRTWSVVQQTPRAQCHAFFVTRGKASFAGRDGGQIELKSPFILWLPSSTNGQFHIEAGGEGVTLSILEEFLWRTIGGAGLAMRLRPLLDRIAFVAADKIAPHLDEFGVSFSALARESRDQQSAASVMMGLHLGIILVAFWRASGFESSSNPRGAGAGTAQRFRHLVELHYREGLGIDEFARLLGVTRAHLHDACARSARATPLGLVHARLIEEACRRLKETELSVEQIGYSLGFRDPGYFNRFFKRQQGVAPGAYRRALGDARNAGDASSYAAWP
jgi:AraC family transcriptional regulator, transcriptional activator of pobA